MPTFPQTANASESSEPSARPWSRRLIVRMLLVVAVVSLLCGGMGAFISYAGLVQAWSLPTSAEDLRLAPLYFGAALAALLSGLFFWWLFILRRRRLTLWRAAWAGVVSSLVAHPLTWLFTLGLSLLMGEAAYWGLPPAPSVDTVLLYGGGYAAYSLILAGWFTTPLGGLAGVAVATALRDLGA
jgi:uncharacterized BrkB/YihY/UPF0761 family membrane protein